MRWTLALALLVTGCTGEIMSGAPGDGTETSDGGRPMNPGTRDAAEPPAWTLDIDTRDTNRFLEGSPATAEIRGRVTSSVGLDHVTVGSTNATIGPDSTFTQTVPVMPGLQVIPIQAFDRASPQHSRNGHLAVINTRFLPEGSLNPGAAAATLDDQILAGIAAPIREMASRINLADQIRMSGGSFSQSGCDITLGSVSTDPPDIQLVIGADGTLWVQFIVNNLRIDFSGVCSIPLLGSSTLNGTITSRIVVSSAISAPPSTTCVDGLQHTPAMVDLPDFNLDLHVSGGGLLSLISPIVGSIMEGQVKTKMQDEIGMQANTLFDEQLGSLDAFGGRNAIDFQGKQLFLELCLTGLGPENGTLRARLGAKVTGESGTLMAPGAPQVDGELPASQPSSLWLDSNLVGQLMFSIWRAEGLQGDQSGAITFGLLSLLSPGLRGRYPDTTPVTVGIDASLPPVVRAAPDPAMGDLVIELGDLMIDLKVEGQLLFRVSALVRLTVQLVPMGDTLVPTVASTQAEVHLLSEPVVDVDDAVIEGAVQAQVAGAASGFLGSGGIALPSFGGVTFHPTDVVAEPGGRYVRVSLGAAAAPAM